MTRGKLLEYQKDQNIMLINKFWILYYIYSLLQKSHVADFYLQTYYIKFRCFKIYIK